MEKYKIKIGDLASVNIYSNIKIVDHKLKHSPNSLTKTIPATIEYLGNFDNIIESDNYIAVLENNEKSLNIDKENNVAYIFAPQENFFFPDIVYLAIGMLSAILQKQGYYFLQSSVVKYDDKNSIMLLGDPNAGKTTLAFKLMNEYGYQLISNDNVLVNVNDNELKTICGTKSVQMRYGGIKLYFPELLDKIKVDEEDRFRNDWDIKIYIDSYLKNNGYGYADDSVVTDIYNITTFKSGDTFIRKREKIDEILLMYEHLTKQIRSNRYALMGIEYPLPSFEDEKYMIERYNMAKLICDNTNIYDARGTVDELTRKLKKNNG